MTLKNHILVPVDFSPQSLIALGQSYNLARLTKATITLIYVIEDNLNSRFSPKKEGKIMEKGIRNELQKLGTDSTSKSGVHTDVIISRGKVYEEVHKAAKALKSSLIIMGTNGSVGIKKRFIGSNALRVIREAPCPVITIKGKKHRSGCKHIVLPLDLTKETKEKVSKSVEIAKLYGSHIYLLSVLTTDDEFIVNKLKRQMTQVEDFIKERNVTCSSELIHGSDVTEEILKYAKKVDADLIVIMTQRETGWTNMFIGTKAQEVINNTDIPVLSIRPMVRKNTALSAMEY